MVMASISTIFAMVILAECLFICTSENLPVGQSTGYRILCIQIYSIHSNFGCRSHQQIFFYYYFFSFSRRNILFVFVCVQNFVCVSEGLLCFIPISNKFQIAIYRRFPSSSPSYSYSASLADPSIHFSQRNTLLKSKRIQQIQLYINIYCVVLVGRKSDATYIQTHRQTNTYSVCMREMPVAITSFVFIYTHNERNGMCFRSCFRFFTVAVAVWFAQSVRNIRCWCQF